MAVEPAGPGSLQDLLGSSLAKKLSDKLKTVETDVGDTHQPVDQWVATTPDGEKGLAIEFGDSSHVTAQNIAGPSRHVLEDPYAAAMPSTKTTEEDTETPSKTKKAKKSKKSKRGSKQIELEPSVLPLDPPASDFILPSVDAERQASIEQDILKPAFADAGEASKYLDMSEENVTQPITSPESPKGTAQPDMPITTSKALEGTDLPKSSSATTTDPAVIDVMQYLDADQSAEPSGSVIVGKTETTVPLDLGEQKASTGVSEIASKTPLPSTTPVIAKDASAQKSSEEASSWGSSLWGAFGWGKKRPTSPTPAASKSHPATSEPTPSIPISDAPVVETSKVAKSILDVQTAFPVAHDDSKKPAKVEETSSSPMDGKEVKNDVTSQTEDENLERLPHAPTVDVEEESPVAKQMLLDSSVPVDEQETHTSAITETKPEDVSSPKVEQAEMAPSDIADFISRLSLPQVIGQATHTPLLAARALARIARWIRATLSYVAAVFYVILVSRD